MSRSVQQAAWLRRCVCGTVSPVRCRLARSRYQVRPLLLSCSPIKHRWRRVESDQELKDIELRGQRLLQNTVSRVRGWKPGEKGKCSVLVRHTSTNHTKLGRHTRSEHLDGLLLLLLSFKGTARSFFWADQRMSLRYPARTSAMRQPTVASRTGNFWSKTMDRFLSLPLSSSSSSTQKPRKALNRQCSPGPECGGMPLYIIHLHAPQWGS
jgi:hypothetical protein